MSEPIHNRLERLGIVLPNAAAPAANYVPFVVAKGFVYVSGQIPSDEKGLIIGRLGENLDTEDGARAAWHCGLSLLAQLRAACDGDLERLQQIIRLNGFVNSTADFTDQSQVVNGASDLMVEVLGDRGRHARSAVGVSSLPFGVAVEIEGIFQIE